MLLFYDTETTGFPDKYKPLGHPSQPHCVQLAGILAREDGYEVSSINLIIRPDGWSIPKACSDIHGITDEVANAGGIREVVAAACFYDLLSRADMVIAHNEQFDRKIVGTMFERAGRGWVIDKPSLCTMEESSALVNLPPTERMIAAGIDKPKSPKLEEAYWHFFGEKLEGAHDALVDVRACARVYFHLMKERT